ncbi:hypothetical protein HBH53_162670 [Parastagonospora nodorum]|nr:hypothetical protein HBH53_162670 [Parastagonospora nodorum]KAH5113327.1 hypothetical protein HBH72_003050 [Parastagonospora nodorum]KAH5682833.1 hypothetical protein HBI21_037370 [Parastagonospora nodorum]KAH6549786.1 hypothetical protein HBI07_053860 [Parastagonospora nodorum]
MDVPDLSLRNTFSPQLLLKDSPKPLLLKDSPNTPTCAMCKYTIYTLDCGHAAEDHVDSKDCPYFQKTDVACDRDNPGNRNRVSIKSEDRNGLCNNCRRRQREIDELKAISRDQEREKQQKLAEAEEARKASKAHEERFLKDAAEEYARIQREQEQKDIELALQQSREAAKAAEAARLKQEQEDLARALRESQQNVTLEKKTPTQLPSPPATPVRTARPRPAEKPAAPVDFSKPAGQQSGSIGHYTIGGRRAPIHDSQKEKATYFEMSSPATPQTPAAPVARLGGGIQPSSPSPRQMPSMQASPMPGGDFRAGLRRTAGLRKSLPAQVVVDDGSELQAHLARRRTMEKVSVEDMMAAYSITPSESVSNRQSRASSPTGSNVSRVSRVSAPRNDSVYGDVELPSALDEQRRKGWRKD